MGARSCSTRSRRSTGVPTAFDGFPAGTRAIELPDESVASTFLDTFGRPKRDTACECERVTDASLGQSLMLLNSNDVQSKLSAGGGRAERLAKDPRPDDQKVDELFWAPLVEPLPAARPPAALDHLAKNAQKRKEAYEDILWALDQRQGIPVQRLSRRNPSRVIRLSLDHGALPCSN